LGTQDRGQRPETLGTQDRGRRPETLGTQDRGRRQTKQKTKKMSNTEPSKIQGRTRVLLKGKQFLPLIRHQQASKAKTNNIRHHLISYKQWG
jgi:hypothetical protein